MDEALLKSVCLNKALSAMTKDQKEEITFFTQHVANVHILSQILQLMNYLSKEQNTLDNLQKIYEDWQHVGYRCRSHAIRLISYVSKKDRSWAFVKKMGSFAKLITKNHYRYDIFDALENVVEEERKEVLDVVADIVEGFASFEDLFLAYRVHKLIELVYNLPSSLRKDLFPYLKKNPIFLLQTDLISALPLSGFYSKRSL